MINTENNKKPKFPWLLLFFCSYFFIHLFLLPISFEQNATVISKEDSGKEFTENKQSEILIESEETLGLELLGTKDSFSYYRDCVTDVMFLYKWTSQGISIIELTDPETGLPLTYKKYKSMKLKNN